MPVGSIWRVSATDPAVYAHVLQSGVATPVLDADRHRVVTVWNIEIEDSCRGQLTTLTVTRRAAIAHRIHAIQHRQERRIVPILEAFFRAQARRVVERWLDSRTVKRYVFRPDVSRFFLDAKATPMATIYPLSEDEILVQFLMRLLTPIVVTISDLASQLVGLDSLPLTDPKLLAILARRGHLIRRISEETRAAIQQTLVDGASAGYSDYHVAHGVPNDNFRGLQDVVTETYRGRAQTIARTETAIAANAASVDRYRDGGVTLVDVYDGEGCGWDGHDDPDEANGSVRTLEEAETMPISHPNCRRLFLPRTESRL